MDVSEVLRRARVEAGLDQRRLARLAGTARTTVVAYESGAQSPTVRQLNRLLAACGVRARVVLEPLTADVDAVLDAAAAGSTPVALQEPLIWLSSLQEAGVSWAFDGASAVAAQGLSLPHDVAAIALVDGDVARSWLRSACALGRDRSGFSLAPNWFESFDDACHLLRLPVSTRYGRLQIRLLAARLHAVQVPLGDRVLPALPLFEVEAAHPALAELLARQRQRSARAA